MNINDITIGEAKQLVSLLNNDAPSSSQLDKGLSGFIGEKCIIRTYSAGVWFGTVKEKSGNEIHLYNARRINYYKVIKGISLSSVANNGVHSESRIAEPVSAVWLQPIEIIPCATNAVNSIEGHESE